MENKNLLLTVVGLGLIAVMLFGTYSISEISEKLSNMTSQLSESLKNKSGDNLGAVAGPEVNSDFFIINGVKYKYFSQAFNKSSTTVCAFPIKGATSTLIYKSIQNNTATSSALRWEFGKSTLFDATTTLIGSAYDLAATKFLTLLASTSPTAASANLIFAPGDYSTTKYGGVAGPINNFTGTCKEVFIEN